MFNDRERAFGIIEAICGARMHPNWFRIGGVAQDLPEGWDGMFRDFIAYLPPRLRRVRPRWSCSNRIFQGAHARASAAYTVEEAIEWGVTGPESARLRLRMGLPQEAALFRLRTVRVRHSHRHARRLLRPRASCASRRCARACASSSSA